MKIEAPAHPVTTQPDDRRFLAAAIRLGQRQLGCTWPNPAVGCIITQDGLVVGTGVTGQGGRPHGETQALKAAGADAKGATAYVSLEPCSHHGKSGPCTQALIEAGIARVVIALGDPDPRVSGQGVAQLEGSGLEVVFEPFADMKALARTAHRGHIRRMRSGRPFVTLKLALSADGAIGLAGEGQTAITGPLTNAQMHGLRARSDAIAIGSGTFLADHPQLTVRLPGLEHRSPQRVLFSLQQAPEGWISMVGNDLARDLQALGSMGLTTLLVEGGGRLANSFLAAGLVDELVLLRGTVTLGQGGLQPFADNPFELPGLAGWQVASRRAIGEDRMMVLSPAYNP